MPDFIKNNPSIVITVATIAVSVVTQWAVLGQRITSIEQRVDRQSTAIMTIQAQIHAQATDNAELKAKIEAINDNIVYIRNRIDRAIQ